MNSPKNLISLIAIMFVSVLFSGCQTVLALRPMDFIQIPIYWVVLSTIFGALQSTLIGEKTLKRYIILNLCFSPLYGFISVVRVFLKSI